MPPGADPEPCRAPAPRGAAASWHQQSPDVERRRGFDPRDRAQPVRAGAAPRPGAPWEPPTPWGPCQDGAWPSRNVRYSRDSDTGTASMATARL